MSNDVPSSEEATGPERTPHITQQTAKSGQATDPPREEDDTAPDPAADQPRKKQKKDPSTSVLTSFTIRNPRWTYILLEAIPATNAHNPRPKSANAHTDQNEAQNGARMPLDHDTIPVSENVIDATRAKIDDITGHLYLRSALKQFLGLYGTAIEFDILHSSTGQFWIRVAAQDASALIAAVGSWSGPGTGSSSLESGASAIQGLVVKDWSAFGPGMGSQAGLGGQALFDN